MNLVTMLFTVVTFFLFSITLIAVLAWHVSERMLAQYFRYIESLFAENTLPEDWVTHLRKLAKGRQDLRQQLWNAQSKAFLLKKITKLHKFFETCRFVDSEEARILLLNQIDAVKERWEISNTSEIIAFYKLNIDVDNELRNENLSVHEDKR
ncbi:MAG: hypothetical protein OSB34_07435 [Planktomarina sp.]|nr:hypothetical protein [Planktomarina sp.]